MQDLEFLSSGLEGRSSNPVALLFDNLTHPDADIGMENASILEWRHHTEKALDHVVLGKMPVGGAWQVRYLIDETDDNRLENILNIFLDFSIFYTKMGGGTGVPIC